MTESYGHIAPLSDYISAYQYIWFIEKNMNFAIIRLFPICYDQFLINTENLLTLNKYIISIKIKYIISTVIFKVSKLKDWNVNVTEM